MAKKFGPVKCRWCGREIDRNSEAEGADWIMRSRGWFYCEPCFKLWQASKDVNTKATDEQWKDFAWDYLRREVKMSLDFGKFDSQWKNFKKAGRTSKGMYFSLRYFYDVQHGDKNKALGGIGIVPSIYEEATQYWVQRENAETGILAAIIEQQKLRQEQETKTVHLSYEQIKETKRSVAKKRAAAELDEIAGLEDDDE